MPGKHEILNSIRRNLPQAVNLPTLDGSWISYDDPREQFCETLHAVGGRAVIVPSTDAIQDKLREHSAWSEAKRICSLVPGIDSVNVDLDSVDDPHDLQDLDFAVMPGQLGVAENAAVWVTDEAVRHRCVYFIAQHLVLVMQGETIVHNMHEAYERLQFDSPRFGVFISGPSKTADIEQSLVIGAHGARSLTVFLLENG